jgi:hypothetical protein
MIDAYKALVLSADMHAMKAHITDTIAHSGDRDHWNNNRGDDICCYCHFYLIAANV